MFGLRVTFCVTMGQLLPLSDPVSSREMQYILLYGELSFPETLKPDLAPGQG